MSDDHPAMSRYSHRWRNVVLAGMSVFLIMAIASAVGLLFRASLNPLSQFVEAFGQWVLDRNTLDAILAWLQRAANPEFRVAALTFLTFGVAGTLILTPPYFWAKKADRRRYFKRLRMPAGAPPKVKYDFNGMPTVQWTDRYPNGESKEDASRRRGSDLVFGCTVLGALIGFGAGQHWGAALVVAIIGSLIGWSLRPHVLREKLSLRPASPFEAAGFCEARCEAVLVPRDDGTVLFMICDLRPENSSKIE